MCHMPSTESSQEQAGPSASRPAVPERGGEAASPPIGLSIDHYERIVDWAHKQIDWVRSAFAWVSTLVAVLIAVGMWFSYTSIRDYRADAQQAALEISTSAQRTAETAEQRQESALKVAELELRARLDEEFATLSNQVEERIDDQFAADNIRALVEQRAQQRIDQVADVIISDKLESRVSPKMVEAEQGVEKLREQVASVRREAQEARQLADEAQGKLAAVESTLAEARATLESLQSFDDFNRVVMAARNDDRASFDKLAEWAKDSSYSFAAQAEDARRSVVEDHNTVGIWTAPSFPWRPGLDPSTLGIAELTESYAGLPNDLKPALICYIWDREDIDKTERMRFLAKVLRADPSLKAAEYAGRFLQNALGLSCKPLEIERILSVWNARFGSPAQ